MNPTPTAAPADPVLLLLALGWLTIEAAAVLIAFAVALLLTLAGWRPAAAPAARPAPLPVVLTPAALPPALAAPLEGLTVRELRARARAAGLPQLARSGRRADLIEALA